MFGNNVPRRREVGDSLQFHKVFYTIQGEGPFAGDPAVFIRLTGCNLRCWFCDTEWDDERDPRASPKALATEAALQGRRRTDLVVLTGGEPTRQDLDKLILHLMDNGFGRVQVETDGMFWQDCLGWPGVTVVVSPKTAKVHKEYRLRNVHWKYVMVDGEVDPNDGLPSASTQRMKNNNIGGGAPARPNKRDQVYLQPCDEHTGPHSTNANLAAVRDSALKFGYRAGLQLHKFLGVD